MKDLIVFTLKGLVEYVPLLVSVVAKPKRSILKLITDEPDRLNKALVFCGISIGIAFLLQAPLLAKEQDFVTVAGSMLAVKILAVLTFAGVIVFIFRRFGGKGDYETTLCACLYIISPIYLFLIVTHVLSIGLVASYDTELAVLWRSGQELSEGQVRELFTAAPVTAASLVVLWLSRTLVSIVWFLICWGTYRAIHQVSFAWSSLAYLITTVMWYFYWVGTVLIMRGLHGGMLSPIG